MGVLGILKLRVKKSLSKLFTGSMSSNLEIMGCLLTKWAVKILTQIFTLPYVKLQIFSDLKKQFYKKKMAALNFHL